jgi:protein TonB
MPANNSDSKSPAALTKLIPIAVIAVALIVVAYFFLAGGGKAPTPTASTPNAPAAGAPAAGAQPEVAPELTKEQLLREASAALRESRYVSPAGNNAVEYYLRVLDKDANNQTAKDALRESFPMATGAVEQQINAGGLDEANRAINLLARADPNNYTLTILRSKLDAKKKQTDREQAQQAAATAAAAAKTQQAAAANSAAAAPAAAAPAAASNSNAPASQAAAANNAGANDAAAKPAVASNAPSAAAAPAAAAAGGETHGAEIVKTSPPDYPPDAVRRRQEGWVEVEFTVAPDGSVTNASVVNANPARVFNAAALSAVGRWQFKPRMENGKPVEEKMRRRIEFKF